MARHSAEKPGISTKIYSSNESLPERAQRTWKKFGYLPRELGYEITLFETAVK